MKLCLIVPSFYRLQMKFTKVMFLHLSVSYSVHRWAGWLPSMHWEEGSASRGAGGVCIRDTWDTMGYGQQAGGTHPTGIHSCFFLVQRLDCEDCSLCYIDKCVWYNCVEIYMIFYEILCLSSQIRVLEDINIYCTIKYNIKNNSLILEKRTSQQIEKFNISLGFTISFQL